MDILRDDISAIFNQIVYANFVETTRNNFEPPGRDTLSKNFKTEFRSYI